jgi:Lipid A core - O-antigen ligase and related enzymes
MVRKNSERQFINWLTIVFLTMPHLKTGFWGQFGTLDLMIDIWRLLSFFIVFIWYFFVWRRVSRIVVLFFVAEGYLMINTMIHGGNLYDCVKAAFSIMAVALLYDMLEGFKLEFLEAQLFCFEIVIYINLFTEIAYPDGLYQGTLYSANWFLGYYNTHTRYFIPALMIAYIYKDYTGKKMRIYFLTAAIFLSALLVWSGGTIAALGIMSIVYIFFKNRTGIFNYYNYWLIHLVFFVLVIVMKLQNYLRWFIDGVLGKWSSLTGRMLVWQAGLELVGRSFIFGYGVEGDEARQRHFLWAVHSHNQLLEILCQGGIIYLILMLMIVGTAGKCLGRNRSSETVKVISIAFLGWCVHSLVEPYITSFLMGMFIIAYHSQSYVKVWTKGIYGENVRRQGRIG